MSEFVNQLDKLLAFFVEKGMNSVIPVNVIPAEFQTTDLKKMLAILENLKFVMPYSVDFKDGKPSVEFFNLYITTPAGVNFALNSSFTDEAKIRKMKRQLFNFKRFTMGWDTAIAFLALMLAIIALIKSYA